RGVALDLVHGLPDADGGREVDDGVDAVERRPYGVAVAHVAGLQLDGRIKVVRPLAVRMDLRVEVVQRPHLVAVGEQPVSEVRADESGAAGDQNPPCARAATSGRSRRPPSTARLP